MNPVSPRKTIIISPGKKGIISGIHLKKLAKMGNVLIGPEDYRNLGLLLSEKLNNFGLMVSSTDTIPGLICPFDNREKIDIIYKIKKRDPVKKLLLLASSTKMALDFCPKGWLSPSIRNFCNTIWPNPVTLILPLDPMHRDLFRQGEPSKKHKSKIPSIQTYAVRVPDSPWLRYLMKKIRKPLVAPSANISGQSVPENPLKIIEVFQNWIDLYFFSGEDLFFNKQLANNDEARIQREASAIIDISTNSPKIIRKGKFAQESIIKLWQKSLGKF